MNRIQKTSKAITEMVEAHGTPKPEEFGGGIWDMEEEFKIYKEQVGKRYTKLQWSVIELHFKSLQNG